MLEDKWFQCRNDVSLITVVFTERCHFMNVHCGGPFSVSLAFILKYRINNSKTSSQQVFNTIIVVSR